MTERESDTVEVGRMAGLRPYVPRAVRDWRPNPAADGEVREVDGTLLSADLSGFTALSERLTRLGREGAEELTNLLNACFEGMIAAMEARGGDVLKFGGDALLVLFTGPDHAARACGAAAATRTLIRTPLQSRMGHKVQLRISQGLHSGRFLLFAVRGNHIEVLVSGPAATETVTCESIASPGEILASPTCAALVDASWLSAEKEGRRLLRREIREAPREGIAPGERPGSSTQRTHTARQQAVTSATDLESFVPDVQREQIAAGVGGEHKRATVGFLKFSHTDSLVQEMGGEALATRLARLAAAVSQAEAKHGVHWLSTDIYADGGKIILTAGAPVSTGHDEEAMLGALRDVLDAGVELDLAAGANAGPVFVGNLGSAVRRTFTVMGDAVNLAARLMQRAATGQLVASEAVFEATRAPFELQRLEPFLVKGKTQPIRAAVVGKRLSALSHASTTFPLVGREGELARLRPAIERARTGIGGVVDIVGDAGTGKTRLVDELRTAGDLASVGVICGQYAQTSPYFAVRLILRTIAGIDLQASRGAAGEALHRFVEGSSPELVPWMPLLSVPFDADAPSTKEASLIAPAHRREQIHQLVVQFMTAAVRSATMFIIDDAHWIDDASRELLETVASVIDEHPWLLVICRRPDGPAPLSSAADMLHIDLRPLSADASRFLAFRAAGDETALRPDDWQRIVDHAEGNPLFLIEMVSSAVGYGTEAIPENIESIVTSRVDRLSASDRLLLRESSVLGRVIDVELLAEALADDDLRADQRWAPLEPFLAAMSPGRFAFRHELHRQAAYDGLSYRRRREIHRRVGETLERRRADGEGDELLSVHFSRAGDHERSWKYSLEAADRARDKYANVESAALYRRALGSARFLTHIGPDRIASALESLGDVCELGARYEDAARAYADARRRLASPASKGPTSVSALVQLCRKSGVVDERVGRYLQALRWYGRGLRLANTIAPDREQHAANAQLRLAYAGVRYRQGRYREMLRWASDAAHDAERCGDRSALGHAYFLLDLGHASIGGRESGAYAQRAVEIFEQLDDFVGLSRSLNNLGISAWRSGDWAGSLDLFDRSRRAYERSGDVVGAAMAANNAAEILSDQGRLDQALTILRDALRICRSARYPSGTAVVTGNIGQAEARAGRCDDGLRLLNDAIEILKNIGAAGYQVEATVKQKEALLLAGRFDDVVEGSDALLRELDANDEDVLAAALQRHRALAQVGMGSLDDALKTFEDSIRRAEDASADYELGRSLLARARLTCRSEAERASDERRGRTLLKRLDVEWAGGASPTASRP
jgi:class 3 adenylate cyclase/tetratricopeptide (TPR) repeat protein